MLLHKRWMQLVFGALFFAGVLACQTSDTFLIAQQATATPTRTPRPTFTPLPTVTLTPEPPPTQPPPPPAATRTPTKRPTARPTTRVPTKPPAPPPAPVTQPTQPPAAKFQYGVNAPWCEHAGGSYIKGRVYDSTSSDANGVGGIKVGLGDSSGTNPWVTVPSFDDGYYSFTLTPDGGGAKTGTYYLWLMDGSGNRISDLGGPIVINGLGADAPGSCWAGGADFWRR